MAWAVTRTGASPTGSSGVCGRPLRVLTAAHCMAHSRLALRMLAARSAPCRKKVAQSAKRHVEHRHSPTPRPRHCHARTRCPAPCTRAHACRARSSRTHHACAPRQPCTCSHAATRAHVKKLGCRARVTGHWLPVGRLAADTSGAHTALQTRSPSPLPATMRHRHAVHAIHHRRCHRTQRHDDNDRDEDERHDEEDQGHDG